VPLLRLDGVLHARELLGRVHCGAD
jgi:hypothetical protein